MKVLSLLEALQVDMGQVKRLIQNWEPNEKGNKKVPVESFKRLQDKVQNHGELLTRLKNQDG